MEFKRLNEIVDGVEYSLIEMDAGTALAIQNKYASAATEQNSALQWLEDILAASLRVSVEDLRKMPYTHYQHVREQLSPIALEINGLSVKQKEGAEGERQAGESPAA